MEQAIKTEDAESIRPDWSRHLILPIGLIVLGLILPALPQWWMTLGVQLSWRRPGLYGAAWWEHLAVGIGLASASFGLSRYAKLQGHPGVWGTLGLVPTIGPLFGLVALSLGIPVRRSFTFVLMGIAILLQSAALVGGGHFELRSAIFFTGLLSAMVSVASYAKLQEGREVWGGRGLVPFVGPLLGLVAHHPVAKGGKNRGIALIILGTFLQWVNWSEYLSPFIPVWPSSSFVLYEAMVVVGLLFLAFSRRRSVVWCLLGFLPLMGPVIGLFVLLLRSDAGSREQVIAASTNDTVVFSYRTLMGMALLMATVSSFGWHLHLTSTSPDGTHRVQLIQSPHMIDINFGLYLQETNGYFLASTQRIFVSPDEGPIEARIVWTKDSSRFVLLGRRFFVKDRTRLPNGDQLYLMYDLKTGHLWCNASQARHPT